MANLIYIFQPMFTVIFAWVLLNEMLGPAGWLGKVCIGAAVLLVAVQPVTPPLDHMAALSMLLSSMYMILLSNHTRSDAVHLHYFSCLIIACSIFCP